MQLRQVSDNKPDVSEDEENNTEEAATKMSLSEGLIAVEYRTFEQHDASAMGILFLCRLRDEAARRRAQCETQKKLTISFK